ncbi:MAG: amidohydrolase [Candidatus Bathyarchaeia archaeon]
MSQSFVRPQLLNEGNSEFADLVLINGKIITVDAEDTIAQAVAVKNGTIVKVGADSEVEALIGPETEVIDLGGKAATPGLIDAHGHVNFGYFLVGNYSLDLRPGVVKSIAEIASRVKEATESTPKGEWIRGAGWLPLYLREKRWPTKEDLDSVSPDHPVLLTDLTGWYAVVNSYALRLSNITAETPNPPGGVIDRDPETGEPTGLLLNHAAIWMVKVPEPTMEQREEGLKYAAELFLSEGITTVHDNWILDQNALKAFLNLESRGELPIRTSLYLHISSKAKAQAALNLIASLNLTKPYRGRMVTFEGWKLQIDGTAVSAYTYEPHNGKVNMLAFPYDEFKSVVSMLHASGLQLSIHVIGDKAFDATLDAIEAALRENPRADHRHRIEHVLVSPGRESIERAKALGVVLSLQPTFIYNGGDGAALTFGPERAKHLIPVKTALEVGIPIGFGSDYPTTIDTSPRRTIWSAVTRETFGGTVVGSEESITVKEALRLHTIGSAYLAHQEESRGSIEEGKLADIVIWSDDPYSITADKLLDMRAETTIVGGKIVYQAPTERTSTEKPSETKQAFNIVLPVAVILVVIAAVSAIVIIKRRRKHTPQAN